MTLPGFPRGDFFVNSGKFGVLLFFMISAFLFYRWLDNSTLSPAQLTKKLIVSRVRRIVPVFWFPGFIVLSIGLAAGSLSPTLAAGKDFIGWMLFMGSYHVGDLNTSFINAGVEWTLRIEWLLYLFIPLIYLVNRATKGKYLTAIILASICLIFILAVAIRIYGSACADPRPVLGFAMGYLAYKYRAWFVRYKSSKPAAGLSLLLACFALCFTSNTYFYVIFLGCLALIFFVVSSGNALFGLLNNKTVVAIGEVSYSLYLMHGIVLYFIKQIPAPVIQHSFFFYTLLAPLFFVGSFYVAKFTYLMIEKPFIGKSTRKDVAINATPTIQDIGMILHVRITFIKSGTAVFRGAGNEGYPFLHRDPGV